MSKEFEGKNEIFFSAPPYQDVLDEDVAPPHPLHKDVPGLSHLHLAACPDLRLELLHLVEMLENLENVEDMKNLHRKC